MQRHVDNKYTFLLILNISLLVVGCLMDIFSALVVVVPLIAPVAAGFGIDPVAGIVFLQPRNRLPDARSANSLSPRSVSASGARLYSELPFHLMLWRWSSRTRGHGLVLVVFARGQNQESSIARYSLAVRPGRLIIGKVVRSWARSN
jgi:hypothetical protein